MFNKGKYVILQLLLMLISPITSFIVCLRFYKSTISQIFMIVFAFYFGMLMEVGNDLANHYNNMQLYYAGKSISEILRNPLIYGMGHDYFHVAVKIFVSRFSIGMFLLVHRCFLKYNYVKNKLSKKNEHER